MASNTNWKRGSKESASTTVGRSPASGRSTGTSTRWTYSAGASIAKSSAGVSSTVLIRTDGGTMAATDQFDVFISYARAASSDLADDLHTGLEKFAKPWHRLQAIRVFHDDSSMAANTALWKTIERGLSEAMVHPPRHPEAAHSGTSAPKSPGGLRKQRARHPPVGARGRSHRLGPRGKRLHSRLDRNPAGSPPCLSAGAAAGST